MASAPSSLTGSDPGEPVEESTVVDPRVANEAIPGRAERAAPGDPIDEDHAFMALALIEAKKAASIGEVPIGAVIVYEGRCIARAHNRRETAGDPLGHAEILALRDAAQTIDGWRLNGCTLYVTLEPCAMCAGALVQSRVDRLVFGTRDPKAGFCGSLGDLARDPRLNHRLEIREGVYQEECSQLLKRFFADLRRARNGSDL